MKPIVYIETTIPSFYYEMRTEPVMLARRNWTVKWWDQYGSNYQLVTSPAVIDELQNGDYPNRDQILDKVQILPIVPVIPEIDEIIRTYISHKLMPSYPLGDALHLALASYYKCDFLVTWNCKHLANANKFRHIQRINTLLGLYVPLLVTPIELIGEER